ncbi:MAG: hypothetical protein MZW92_72435 [Comamonadaceae bacterium]|nr:hypothetical protein [Comamonadaceae bacterium]
MYNRSTRYQSRRRLSASLGMQFSPYKVNFDRVHSGKDFNQCGEETSECDEKADSGNCSEWRQGNRVTVSREDYNLRKSDQRTTNDYDRKQASTRKYYGKETSECDEEADGNSSKLGQGNRVTVSGKTTICTNLMEELQTTMTESKRSTRKYYGERNQ